MIQLTGRPLIDTAADARLYVPRHEHDGIVTGAEQGLNILVTGPRGSGKTTLLRQILRSLRDAGAPGVFVDGKLAPDARSFLQLVRFQIGQAPNLPENLRETYSRVVTPRPTLGEDGLLLDLIDSMRGTEDDAHTTVLADGLPSPDVAHALFGRLRDELWQLPLNWIVAADERERAALLEPPADAFFDRVIGLDRMGVPDQVEMLRRRGVGADPDSLIRLAVASDGNPRTLLTLARETGVGQTLDDALKGRARRETAASEISRPASMLLNELETLGSASASDEELLRRLGWTRPRAAQVLAELENAGLVAAREVKGSAGRPRKVFSPNDSFSRR